MSTSHPGAGSCFLGIDVGTSGTKALAIRVDGTIAAAAVRRHVLATPRPGWVEQDPDDWWRATSEAVRETVEQLPNGSHDIEAVGLAGHMSSMVTLDAAGRPVRPCLVLSDSRAGAEAAWLDGHFGERVEQLCGTRPVPTAVAPRMLWLRDHEPDAYRRTRTFVFAKDDVRARLTGRVASEPTDCGNTMLLDLASGTWDVDLCREAGIDPEKLPDLLPTLGVAGGVTRAAASATGLRYGTPVIAGGSDMAAAVTGSGVVAPGPVGVTIGTAAPVTACFRALPRGGAGRITFHPHAMPGWLFGMGSVFSGGLSLRWLAHALGEDEALERDADAWYARASNEAAAAPAGSGGVVFLPFLVGSGSPAFDAAMRGTFVGLSLASGRGCLTRAVFEGVACNIRGCIEALVELGAPVGPVHLGGGGSRSAVWRAILAGVLGRPVRRLAVPDVSALGAAALAAVGLGAFPDVPAASNTLVRFGEETAPAAADAASYEQAYATYRAADGALGKVYGSIRLRG